MVMDFQAALAELCQGSQGAGLLWQHGWSLASAVFNSSHGAVFCVGCRAASGIFQWLCWGEGQDLSTRLGLCSPWPLLPLPSSPWSPAWWDAPDELPGKRPSMQGLLPVPRLEEKEKNPGVCLFHICFHRGVFGFLSGLTRNYLVNT